MQFLQTVSYSILINCFPTSRIPSKKGLRQGDPMYIIFLHWEWNIFLSVSLLWLGTLISLTSQDVEDVLDLTHDVC